MTDKPPSAPSAEDQCWDYIEEMLGMVRLHCDVAQNYCEMRDRHGLNYQFRRLIPHLKAATATFKELENMLVVAELKAGDDELTQQRGGGAKVDREPAANARRNP